MYVFCLLTHTHTHTNQLTHTHINSHTHTSTHTHKHSLTLVFVMNHSSPDDFQPLSLREMHTILATSFKKTKVNIAGGASLAKSGIVPVGRGFPGKKSLKTMDTIDPGEVNLHLLPTNRNITDTYNAFCTTRPEKSGRHTLHSHVHTLMYNRQTHT